MRNHIFFSRKKSAQAMVEFAIALPVLLLLLYGILEAGRLLFLYSTVVTASRQASRYGSTTGEGGGSTPLYGDSRSTVKRFQDCAGIRGAADAVGYLSSDGFDIDIARDDGPNDLTPTAYCFDESTIAVDTTFRETELTGNNVRIVVTVSETFVPLVPNLVPFAQRAITATSARTILYSVPIVVEQPPQLVPQVPTTTTIMTSPNPSNIGQDVTVTITVGDNDSDPATIPQGTVIVTTTDNSCNPTLNSSGVATCTFNFSNAGDFIITAIYTPTDENHLGSVSDPYTHRVRFADTVTTIITPQENGWSVRDEQVLVAVTVTGGSVTPQGTVDIDGGGSARCTLTLAGGAGSCYISFNNIGQKTITATYNPSSSSPHNPSTDSVVHWVVNATPTATIPPTIAPNTPTPTPTLSPTPIPTRVTSCDGITTGPITPIGNQLSLTIYNPHAFPLTIKDVTVTWNDDKGHETSPKALVLQGSSVNGVLFWTGNIGNQSTYTIDQTAFLPGTSPTFGPYPQGNTITFTFNQSYDILDDTERVVINFLTPGCENNPITARRP